MINDVVFQQNYASKVNAHFQEVANQAYRDGRQQGWNDMMFAINKIQEKKLTISQENIIEELKTIVHS